MANCPAYLEVQHAAWHAGLVAVPVNARLHRDEVAFILANSGTRVVVTDDAHAADVESLPGEVPSLEAVVRAPGPQWDELRARDPCRWPTAAATTRPGCSTPAAPPDGPRARRSPTATS